jgi:hypothetical protein
MGFEKCVNVREVENVWPGEFEGLILRLGQLPWGVGHDPNFMRERGVKHNQVVLVSRQDVINMIKKFFGK